MPTVEQTEKIIHHEGEVIIKEVTLSTIAKSLLGILALAVMGSIAFIVQSQFALKDDIISVHDLIKDDTIAVRGLIKDDISKMQILINDGIRTDILTLVARNTAEVKQLHNWKNMLEVKNAAILKEYNMRVTNNKEGIKDIIKNKADNRWRRSDEETQNEKMDLIHDALGREIKHNSDTMLEKCNLMSVRMENMEKAFDNWTEESEKEFRELLDKFLKHLNIEK